MNKKVLVVAVHPDDETLGCGGTILKHKDNGDQVHWLIVTKPPISFSDEFKIKRATDIELVAKHYDFDEVHQLGLEASTLSDSDMGQLIAYSKELLNSIKPEIVYLPFMYDAHSDHRVAFRSLFSCLKKFRAPFLDSIFMMETLSETDFSPPIPGQTFVPNTFVNIEKYFNKKLDILSIYETELAAHPFPRSIENIRNLAMLRGSQSNSKYAESFMMLNQYL